MVSQTKLQAAWPATRVAMEAVVNRCGKQQLRRRQHQIDRPRLSGTVVCVAATNTDCTATER
eukprot:8046871-Pyramimonas_sp.AAC.1